MKFTKQTTNGGWTGGWNFGIGGLIFTAWRNEAGFAGRQWELHRDGRIIEDMLATRQDCIDLARAIATGGTWRTF